MPDQPTQNGSHDERLNEVIAAYLDAAASGSTPDRDEVLARHPDLADGLASFFADHDEVCRIANPPDIRGLTPPARPEEVGPGRRFGDYELLEEVARGGMGIVYRARQVSLGRVVALKMILAGQLASDEEVARFHTEARTAAGLRHPNIVSVHEVGEHDGRHYFSMDFIEGQSLADLVRERPLPPRQAAEYLLTVAQAVDFAHRHGVLHRDLKPSNVLLDAQRQPHVTDFGLAKRTDQNTGQTASGAVLGTPGYMPPEQARGAKDLGPAADVYSLGAVLYELVVGR